MSQAINKEFGTIITRLIQSEDLTRNTAKDAFIQVLQNEVTDMQQGAFLAALTAKGEN